METLRIIALITSICSLAISILALIYSILIRNRYEFIIEQYKSRLKRTQIEKITIYNFIRHKRNLAMIKRAEFEDGENKATERLTKRAYRTCAFTAAKEEKVLKEIEEYIQEEHLLEI